MALLFAASCGLDGAEPVEVVQGNIVGSQFPVGDAPRGFGLPVWTDDGRRATITSADLIPDPVTTCSATVELWTSMRGIGAVAVDGTWDLSPFEPFELDGSFPQIVAAVDPGPDCEPGDIIEYSGFRISHDDRGFPKTIESPMRIEVRVVTEISVG